MIGVKIRRREDFAAHPAGTLFCTPGTDTTAPIVRAAYLGPAGYPELLERRLLEFNYGMHGRNNAYYYFPIGETEQEVREEIETILNLLRAGGQAVADDVVVDLNNKQ